MRLRRFNLNHRAILQLLLNAVVIVILLFYFQNCGGFRSISMSSNSASSNGASSLEACTSSVTPRRVWFLSRSDFDSSIRDILRDDSDQAETLFPPETRTNGFVDNSTGVSIDATLVSLVQQAAEAIAANQGQTQLNVAAANCAQTPGSAAYDSCVTTNIGTYISTLGKSFFRRPLTATEVSDLTAVYHTGFQNPDSGVDPALSGVETLISAFIQDPNFLYRTELGDPNDTTSPYPNLTPYETATALSYALTGSTPDATLMAAADANQLSTPAQLTAQAQRLVGNSTGHSQQEAFIMQWLGSDQVADIGTTTGPITPSIAKDMFTETQTFIGYNLFTGSGTLSSLLSSNFTFANTELANYYGLTPGSTTDTSTFYQVSDGTQRDGILSQGSFLATANGTGIPLFDRGVIIREKLLCETLPSFASLGLAGFTPPTPAPPSPGETTRQEVTSLVPQGTACYECHQYFAPIGFGLENFDVFGRYQATENGGTVDPSGWVDESTSIDPASGTILAPNNFAQTSFSNFNALVGILSADSNVQNCFAKQIMVYTSGQSDVANNDCEVQNLQQQFNASGGNVVDGFLSYIQSTNFIQRAR